MASFEARSIIYDVIGVGFGPANLAIAGALLEQPREVKTTRYTT
jgi:L-ornithine N5-oxygenase